MNVAGVLWVLLARSQQKYSNQLLSTICTVCLAPQQDGTGVLFKAHQSVVLPSLVQEGE